MYRAITIEENEKVQFSILLVVAIGVLLLLGLALFISLFQPEWLNFLWLSVATVSLAAVAGWVLGHFLDLLFEDLI